MSDLRFSAYLRSMVVGVETEVQLADGRRVAAINFDNAATTPPLTAVMEEINAFAPWYSSIHRGQGHKSVLSSELYDQARGTIADFVKADRERDVVIYTKNTTESINILAHVFRQTDKEQVVLITDMEHLANELPWRDKFKVDYVTLDPGGRLSLTDLESKLQRYAGKVKLVAATGASNVTGYINPVHSMARIAHRYSARIFVDGAQWAPHEVVDMKPHDSDCHLDYLAFSAHKLYAPFGTGALIGHKETFALTKPVYQGGGDVRLVSRRFIEWSEPPGRHEAGTPDIMGVAAMAAAIKTLQSVGMKEIQRHERDLIGYAIDGLSTIPGIRLYSCCQPDEQRVSLISFTLEGVNHHLLATMLACEAGVAVRSGMFCAHPYVEKLLQLDEEALQFFHNNWDAPLPGMVRLSLGLYNTKAEIDVCLAALAQIVRRKRHYLEKYKDCVDL